MPQDQATNPRQICGKMADDHRAADSSVEGRPSKWLPGGNIETFAC